MTRHDCRLTEVGAPGTWNHIVQQSGMFSFLGLPKDIVLTLRGKETDRFVVDADRCTENYHIYMGDNSRISLAGLNTSNVAYVAKAITEALHAAGAGKKPAVASL